MSTARTVARLGYAVVGLAALMVGWDRWEAADSSAGLIALGGGLSLAAAVWVTTDGSVRGALASVGIVVGAGMAAITCVLLASVFVYVGDPARGALFATPIPVVLAGAWVMWQMSHRPWARPAAA
jgi:hypothetical protein